MILCFSNINSMNYLIIIIITLLILVRLDWTLNQLPWLVKWPVRFLKTARAWKQDWEKAQSTFFPTHFWQEPVAYIISLNLSPLCGLHSSFLRCSIITGSQELFKFFWRNEITHVMAFFAWQCVNQKEGVKILFH